MVVNANKEGAQVLNDTWLRERCSPTKLSDLLRDTTYRTRLVRGSLSQAIVGPRLQRFLSLPRLARPRQPLRARVGANSLP